MRFFKVKNLGKQLDKLAEKLDSVGFKVVLDFAGNPFKPFEARLYDKKYIKNDDDQYSENYFIRYNFYANTYNFRPEELMKEVTIFANTVNLFVAFINTLEKRAELYDKI